MKRVKTPILKHFFVVLVFLSCWQCTKEVTVPFPSHSPQLVVNALFQPDSLFYVTLGESRSLLDDRFLSPITDATVKLYQDNDSIDVLIWEGEAYRSSAKGIANTPYQLNITYKEQQLSAKDLLPSTPQLKNIFYQDSVYFGGEGEYYSQLNLEIKNNLKEKSFYEIVSYLLKEHSKEEAISQMHSVFNDFISPLYYDEIINDKIVLNESLLENIPESLLFTNTFFSDSIQTLQVNFRPFNSSFYSTHSDRPYYLILKFRQVSEHYYRYKRNLYIHLNNQESDIWDGTGEPITVYSNIENGLGIFAGFNEVIDTVQKRELP